MIIVNCRTGYFSQHDYIRNMRYYKLFPNVTLYIIDSETFMEKKCTLSVFCAYTFGSVIWGLSRESQPKVLPKVLRK